MFQNRISLIGFTGTDAQVRTTKNNRAVAVLSVATKRSWLDKQSGKRVSRTEWHRIVAWGKLSDFAKTLAKGSHVQIDGELRSRMYTSKDNVRRRISEVHLGSIRKLDRAERPAQPTPASEQPAATAEMPF
ncbi:MAG: single-stranded DNA-binding protein [Acidobacteriia bacterium]|nr:single-stranded DNA-binding protein [Terriglobia bacterium]